MTVVEFLSVSGEIWKNSYSNENFLVILQAFLGIIEIETFVTESWFPNLIPRYKTY